jgi:large subunit ribosomal protein L22
MEVKARLKFLQASPTKVRLVADMIRGMDVQSAANALALTNKSAARPMEKLLKSAIANAENRDDPLDIDRLYVKEISVDGGPSLKRLRPAPQGRAYRIMKRQSHITIKLDSRPE